MAKLCPGQDTRFWKPEDIFELDCGACGHTIEFFKDDVYRRCSDCGKRVENPKFNLGCARWCEHAKDCLGYDPKQTEIEGGEGESLVDRLVERLKGELSTDPGRFRRAVAALEYAREILRQEPGDPRIVLLASLLHEIGVADRSRREGDAEEAPFARRILEGAGVHWSVVDRVCRLVGCEHGADGLDTPEAKAAWDADSMAGMFGGEDHPDEPALASLIEKRFKTRTGREIALRELARARARN